VKRILSYIFPLSLFIILLLLGIRKTNLHGTLWQSHIFNPDIAVIGIYLLWIIYEIKIALIDAKSDNTGSDKGTRELYSISQGVVVIMALWFRPVWTSPSLWQIAGLIMFTTGIAIRISAIRTLGKYYSHTIKKLDNHKIITDGPYRFIRHPAYAGMLAAHIGLTIFYFNYFAPAALLFLLAPSIILRIKIEEVFLLKIEGYDEYYRQKKRLIPYIW